MSDERDKKDDPAQELKQGLTHLWRAARGAATELKKEIDRTDMGKALDDAGREFARAAVNVVDRIAGEVTELAKPRPAGEARSGESRPPEAGPDEGAPGETRPDEHAGPAPGDHPEDDEFDGVKPREKPAGAAPQDPGFRIAIDDEKKKPE
jgi:hypothetical protein